MSTPALPQIATSDAPVPGVEVTPATRLRLLEFHRFEAEGRTFAYLVPSAAIFALDPCALALVDVVMETENAGLDLVDHIRHDLHLDTLRIIVRTGQPGLMNKQTVLSRWAVDDFWLKTEQNATTLRQSICAALRPPDASVQPCTS